MRDKVSSSPVTVVTLLISPSHAVLLPAEATGQDNGGKFLPTSIQTTPHYTQCIRLRFCISSISRINVHSIGRVTDNEGLLLV